MARAAQFTGRACTATISPIVVRVVVALIAGMCFVSDERDECIASQSLGQSPSLRLVDPHQRRFDDEAGIQAKVQGNLQCLKCIVAAVWVTRIICFTHSAD